MLKIEHIGIAVKELSVSIPLFEKLLNSSCYKTEKVESEQIKKYYETLDSYPYKLLTLSIVSFT